MRLFRPRRGVTLTGYALVVGLVAVIAIVATNRIGQTNTALFRSVGNRLSNVVGGDSGGGAAVPTTCPAVHTGCTGTSSTLAALSCQDAFTNIVAASGTPTDGARWIQPSGSASPFQAYCSMDVANGIGWTRVVGINPSDRNHVTTTAVSAAGMTTASAYGKFSDATINALAATEYRLTCNAVPYYFRASGCTFTADSNADSAGCNYSALSRGGPYVVTEVLISNHGGLQWSQSSPLACRPSYSLTAPYTTTGCCHPSAGWGQAGDVYVR